MEEPWLRPVVEERRGDGAEVVCVDDLAGRRREVAAAAVLGRGLGEAVFEGVGGVRIYVAVDQALAGAIAVVVVHAIGRAILYLFVRPRGGKREWEETYDGQLHKVWSAVAVEPCVDI